MECTIYEVACTVTIDPLPPWDWNLCILSVLSARLSALFINWCYLDGIKFELLL